MSTRRALALSFADRYAGLLLAIAYAGLVLAFWSGAEGGFDTLPNVMQLFTQPEIALAGRIHYLAFDLLIGAWEVRTARAERIPFLAVVPCLALTFLFGPAGFLAFTALRAARAAIPTASHGIGVAPDNRTLWVTSIPNNAVFVYSLPDLKPIGEVALPVGKAIGHGPISAVANWVTFTPDSKTVYVSNAALRSVSAIDTKTMTLVAKIAVGEVPKRIGTLIIPDAPAAATTSGRRSRKASLR